ncbi:hypothetical protein T484DRAFT_3297976 [Baffinella frigidus]|nr:hypothetical protein T484DRAFT_3297976 [Cryptophyta sp. CCMP2293]
MAETSPSWLVNKDVTKWGVLVDGSSVSGKAFDAAVSFLCYHNGKGVKDDLTIIHGFDPQTDADKPTYLRGSNILNSYDTLLIRARRQYESAGPHKLGTRFLAAQFKTTAELQEVSKLEWAQGASTVEKAPAVVAALLQTIHSEVHPDFLFMGSFGTGGKKVGAVGSVTDYILRLNNSTMVIIKHWRPIPKLGEPTTFVVALDDSPSSMRGLEQVIYVAKPTDTILGITVSHHHGSKDQAIMDQADALIRKHSGEISPQCHIKFYKMVAPVTKPSNLVLIFFLFI